MADVTTVVLTKMELDTSQAVGSSKALEDQQDKTAEATEENAEATENYTGALDGMIDSLGILPGGLSKGLKGVTNMTKGFKGLRLAIIATGIGALIIALGALFTWFSRSSEGQEKLRVGMAAIGQIVDVLIDTFASFGEVVFNAITKPQEALGKLWTGLKNLVKPGGVSAAWESATTAVSDKYNEIVDKTAEAVSLQHLENQLIKDKLAFVTAEAEMQVKISKLRLDAKNEEIDAETRLQHAIDANLLTNKLYDERARLQKQENAILLERQNLGLNSDADNQAYAESLRDIILLDEQRNNALRATQAILKSVRAEIGTIYEAEQELNEATMRGVEAFKVVELAMGEHDALQSLYKLKQRNEDDLNTQNAIDNYWRQEEAAIQMEESKQFAANQTFGLLSLLGRRYKPIAIANVVISTAEAVMKSFAQTGVFGAIGAAAAIAMGAIQISEINRMQYARGGMLSGRSHRQGGVPIEAEGGEAILNKRSMSNPYLRSLASAINEWGGGVAFAQRGLLVGQTSTTSAINDMSRIVSNALQEQQPVLVLEDFHGANNRVEIKEALSTF